MSRGSKLHPAILSGIPVVIVGAVMLALIGMCVGFPCFLTGIRYGMWVPRCPATDLRLDLQVEVNSVLRGESTGRLVVMPRARWLSHRDRRGTERSGVLARGFAASAVLLDADHNAVEGFEHSRFRAFREGRTADVTLPNVPDGDYVLRVTADAGFESATVDVDLPLYTPALVHLMTDRPLYKPGQDVLLRSLVLDRAEQAPIEGRPGRWRIVDPNGNEMLVEKDHTGPWGIADGSYPLDQRATVGTWTATWETGGHADAVTFEVRPFQLPRVSVEVNPSQSWFAIGEDIVVEGRATYNSGAPIRNAAVELQLQRTDGRWPMPLAWEAPQRVRTGNDGRFRLRLGDVPADLMDRTVLSATVSVTEAAGEVARAATRVVLSKEHLWVKVVTELGDGLVANFNNRAYLRVATPDDVPVRNATIRVTNPFDPLDAGKEAETDADGVAAVQLDPGEPVTVVIPAPPVRVRPFVPPDPTLVSASRMPSGSLGRSERRALDRLKPQLAECSLLTPGRDTDVSTAVQVVGSGRVQRVMSSDDPLGECVARISQRLRMPGAAGVYQFVWRVPDARVPWLEWSHTHAWGSAPVPDAIRDANQRARACLTRSQGMQGVQVFEANWAVEQGERNVDLTLQRWSGSSLPPSTFACIERSFGDVRLAEPATVASMGVSRATLQVPQRPGQVAPQPTTTTAYELEVVALSNDEPFGSGRLIMPPGSIPALRMRATPSLAAPGETVVVDIFRGPEFYGELPETLSLYEGTRHLEESDVVDNSVAFTVPTDVEGFLHVEWGGARTVIYVQPQQPLSVQVHTDATAYRPGATAQLTVQTTAGGEPRMAGVGLVGVDAALAQLAPLLGPEDYGRVTVRATSDQPAFDAFDPRALVLGQLRGENAAKAAVLRIATLPMDHAGDLPTSSSGSVAVDTVEVLTTNFYRALAVTVDAVRAWEDEAPEPQTMTPERMVAFWDASLLELERAEAPAVDGFGRRLTLDVLPRDLLEQVDPRQVVADGTRLPEDVVSFTRYVDEEVAQ